MKKGEETRLRIIEAAVRLLDEHGYHGTGIHAVLAEASAPRGSLYFHFPGGKDEVVVEALRAVGAQISQQLHAAFAGARSPADAVYALCEVFRRRLIETDFRCGCPVSAVSLEVSGSGSPVAAACAEVYGGWRQDLARYLSQRLAQSTDADDTERLAGLVLSLIEGALLLSRVERRAAPLDDAARHITALLSPPSG